MLIEFEKVGGGLGFSIAGGLDHPVQPDDSSVYITHLIEGGAAEADGRLRAGDRVRGLWPPIHRQLRLQLIEVNGVSVLAIPHDDVVKALQRNATGVSMKVSRMPTPKEVGARCVRRSAHRRAGILHVPHQQSRQRWAWLQHCRRLGRSGGGERAAAVTHTSNCLQNGDPSVYITNIIAGGAADKDGRLRIGDKARGRAPHAL